MNEFMMAALEEAEKGIKERHGGPFGAVVVKDGVVIGRGHNQVVKDNDPTEHGEIMAIRDACKNLNTFSLKGCDIYTTGYPCPMCLGAILWANIDKIYYGCNTTDTEVIGFRDKEFYESLKEYETSKLTQLNRDECLAVYEEYAKQKDKTNY